MVETDDRLAVIDTQDFDQPLKAYGESVPEPGVTTSLAVRPEKLVLSEMPLDEHHASSVAVVEDLAFLGSRVRYHLRLPAGRVITAVSAQTGARLSLSHGQSVYVGWRIHDAVLLAD